MISVWDTRAEPDPSFVAAWQAALRSPHAHFAYMIDYLVFEAQHGRPALAVLVDENGRRGAAVLRAEQGGWRCGWPWRWHALIADADAGHPIGFGPEDARWLFERISGVTVGRRLRFFVPHPPPPGIAGYPAGATILQSIDRSDDEILRSMLGSKRRMVRRALDQGYEVSEGDSPEIFREFHDLQMEIQEWRRAERQKVGNGEAPEPGESWREWELPWMWLLVARKKGRIHSGVGDGVIPGGIVEGRTAASTSDARKEGAFALLCFEESRRARDRGHRWLNHGGDTYFKREVSGRLGERVPLWCWMSGTGWGVPNHAEVLWMNLRPAAGRLIRRMRGGRKR